MALASIVIRTKNEARSIGRVLEAIGRQTWAEREVILVDSGSTDGTVEIARHFGANIVEIPPEHFTFGGSLNRGVREARGEYVVALSGHAIPASEMWLASLLTPLDDPTVGAAYGRCLPLPSCNPFEARAISCYFGAERQIQTTYPKFSNANGAWRKAVWELERFDEYLPASEDWAWAAALLRRGLTIVYEPAAIVHHSHNRAPRQLFRQIRAEVAALKLIEPIPTYSLIGMVWFWLRRCLGGWRTTWRCRSHWRWWLYCPIYHLAYVYGYYRGLCDPLFSTYPHAHSPDHPPVPT